MAGEVSRDGVLHRVDRGIATAVTTVKDAARGAGERARRLLGRLVDGLALVGAVVWVWTVRFLRDRRAGETRK